MATASWAPFTPAGNWSSDLAREMFENNTQRSHESHHHFAMIRVRTKSGGLMPHLESGVQIVFSAPYLSQTMKQAVVRKILQYCLASPTK
jgi:hypothetical protein